MKRFFSKALFVAFWCLTWTTLACAAKFSLPASTQQVVGSLQFAQVKAGDDFVSIARRFDVGYFELAAANPQVDPEHLIPGTELVVPTQYVLPSMTHSGLVINLGTMRLYYFPAGKDYFYTYPVGIGKEDWNTPLGVLSITQKIKDPTWVVPDSIYKFRQDEGDPVPHRVLPGPDNPLGDYAMRLSKPTFLIHGTNDPASVGVRSSAGCVHLYPEDIAALFRMVSLKTTVLIINQPIVAGFLGDALFLQAYLPLVEDRHVLSDSAAVARAVVNGVVGAHQVDTHWSVARDVIQEHTGVPAVIGRRASAGFAPHVAQSAVEPAAPTWVLEPPAASTLGAPVSTAETESKPAEQPPVSSSVALTEAPGERQTHEASSQAEILFDADSGQ